MTTITCTRSLSWDMGHRVYDHGSLCRNFHGHRYTAHITASCSRLDNLGMVVDFGVIKSQIGTWIDTNWDHGFCLWEDDPTVEAFRTISELDDYGHKLFLLPYNPTAENLAKYLLTMVCPPLLNPLGVIVNEVEIQETPNGKATASI